MKQYHFKFCYFHQGEEKELWVAAESIRDAKQHAESICLGLHYANDYEEVLEPVVDENSMDDPKYDGQQIAKICAVPADEQPFPLNYWKKAMLFLASGTNCRCCMGWRIAGAFGLGLVLGYLVG